MDKPPEMTGGPAPAGPAPQAPRRSPAAWYRTLGRRGRIAFATAVIATAAVIALAVASVAAGGGSQPRPAAARNFTAPVLGHPGQHISLSSYRGRPVIVNFFASWCAPCQKETPLLARYYRTARSKITVIGIDVNDRSAAALRFVHRTGVSYPVGTDTPPRTALSYGVSGLPQTFFLNSSHRIVKRVFGALTPRELAAAASLTGARAG
ncbi:MAG: TlpA family protein disulfide reductase [Nocardiopsaceae bacterium]|jgi:cytochrome c biogenesis protein CcmG/thiol:disulfide interchange protein DsbE|nr:TlpA family protein disulfide reductase [Nocardiopsaceae bacterium]